MSILAAPPPVPECLIGIDAFAGYAAIVRLTLDIPSEAYYIAKAIAHDRNVSLGPGDRRSDFAIGEGPKERIHQHERLWFPGFPLALDDDE